MKKLATMTRPTVKAIKTRVNLAGRVTKPRVKVVETEVSLYPRRDMSLVIILGCSQPSWGNFTELSTITREARNNRLTDIVGFCGAAFRRVLSSQVSSQAASSPLLQNLGALPRSAHQTISELELLPLQQKTLIQVSQQPYLITLIMGKHKYGKMTIRLRPNVPTVEPTRKIVSRSWRDN
ncbi:hypothetical protein M430DRAFT_207380 [Amorphotheca resinae ATCC 22711]|uniref:Uncharacterized protein n=1 Tax=Amorphotheca resinae ATCC 22711 TaxID=857342 RepID=A0A2T3BBZ3_AMORE|nr:hypothetical protein M430DRAFT_207380 [Amorphotheca resinae ATCC 22711]PSS25841.1 hypothetical protein M430DRAFT_207380 [Amorphotheca resinae ATCC 22711]